MTADPYAQAAAASGNGVNKRSSVDGKVSKVKKEKKEGKDKKDKKEKKEKKAKKHEAQQ